MYAFEGANPSQMYLEALITTLRAGKTLSPRGKKIKEIRPAAVEFTNPKNQVTFVAGRKINPFFQRAEALWILAGRADVEWLTKYNQNMAEFSDDGVYFNAPYGERLRRWNVNSYREFIFNPIDQLEDVYRKILKDTDTRQAVASIYNPLFDNADYGGKDTPCNLELTFKVRDEKLDLTVFNRSNDVHWGLWGANLCQFTTIQMVVASWLGVEVGTYTQITDSLHVYLEVYGAKETDKILSAYGLKVEGEHDMPQVPHFSFPDEPVVTLKFGEFDEFLDTYFNQIDPAISNDDLMKTPSAVGLLSAIKDAPDEYFKDTILSMFAYRAHRVGNVEAMYEALKEMKDTQWKVSCLYFLNKKYGSEVRFTDLFAHYPEEMKTYIMGG